MNPINRKPHMMSIKEVQEMENALEASEFLMGEIIRAEGAGIDVKNRKDEAIKQNKLIRGMIATYKP